MRNAGHTGVLFAAQAVSMAARCGTLTEHAVDDLRVKAEELLERGDDLRAAILSFATMYLQYRRDPDAIKHQGEYLGHAINIALNPDAPALRARRDIDG